jgi:hypothetical protein
MTNDCFYLKAKSIEEVKEKKYIHPTSFINIFCTSLSSMPRYLIVIAGLD